MHPMDHLGAVAEDNPALLLKGYHILSTLLMKFFLSASNPHQQKQNTRLNVNISTINIDNHCISLRIYANIINKRKLTIAYFRSRHSDSFTFFILMF